MRYLSDTNRKVNAIKDCQAKMMTIEIIATLNASTGKLLQQPRSTKTRVRTSKIVSEYDQEIPQLQTANKPLA